jgi:hypothetical protein
MKNGLTCFAALFILFIQTVEGQTIADIQAKYKKYNNSQNAYSISEHIWMTPEYATDGEVCRMKFFPKRDLFKDLPFDEFMNVLDSIVPLEKRGGKKDSFVGGATGGGIAWTTFKYEKVTLTFSFSFDVEASIKSSKEFTFSEVYSSLDEKQEVAVKPEDDFLFYRGQKFEVAAITWNDRKCIVK